MITDGVASVIYGDPRFTRDVDVVMELDAAEASALRSAFDRRIRLEVGDTEIWVAPIEYVILRKLEYYEQSGSDRHLRDVALMLRISGDTVNSDVLREWSECLDLQGTLEPARRFSPD